MASRRYFLILSTIAAASISGAAWPHSVGDQPNFLTPQVPTATDSNGQLFPAVVEGVIDQFKLWQAGSVIRGCFFQSSPAVRVAFVEAANEWLTEANLSIDFGQTPQFRSCSSDAGSQIRISFQPVGNWSYVGTDSIRVDLNQPSMNIQSGNAMGVSVTEMGSFRGTVLHEIGHALSLQHEHQSPEASCDTEFDWDTVYPEFKQRYGWDRAKVDHNLGTLVKSKRLRTTAYDPHSIMHYYFPAWMFRDGEASACYTGHNHTLSPLDIASIKSAYPQDPGAQLQLVNGRLEATKSLIEESISDDEDFRDEVKRAIQDVVKDNFPQADISIISGDSIATGDKSPVINRTSTEGGDIKIDIK